MNKALFASNITIDFDSPAGIAKKLAWQAKAFQEVSHNEAFCQFVGNGKIFITKPSFDIVATITIDSSIMQRATQYKRLAEWCISTGVDFLYFRFDHFDSTTYNFFKRVKDGGAYIVLEHPTYPYAEERSNRHKRLLKQGRYLAYIARKAHVLDENLHIRKASRVIDGIVTYMPYETIWNIPVLRIDNGVDMDATPLVTPNAETEGREIERVVTLACVANLAEWHGLDRLLEGMAKYSGIPSVVLKVAGPDTSEMLRCKRLVSDLGLEQRVAFLGQLNSRQLDMLFDTVDIAVGSLGLHRIGLAQGSTLKVKEYCARGVPFIYSYDEAQLKGDEAFALRLPADESPVDIERIVDYYHSLPNREDLSREMRDFAETHFSWESQMAIVLDEYLLNHE